MLHYLDIAIDIGASSGGTSRASAFEGLVDVNAPDFLAPERMKAAFDGSLSAKPERGRLLLLRLPLAGAELSRRHSGAGGQYWQNL